ncbi:MAG: type IV secretory system conjugative DNA transfer family protein [Candidatus Dormibacteraeota bacterium]|nr:type IV secretory system conjugative DNA transfer family protein [Candidatus Dormibacteraeota bacterium]
MNELPSRWGPVAAKAAGWLLILAWGALLGWWVHITSVSEIITWIVLTLLGWWLLPRARRLWWQYGWHWPLSPAPPPGPPPSFRICCGRVQGDWISAPPQVAALALGPPRSGKTRGVIIPNVAAWEGPVLVTSTRRDVLDATCAWRSQKGTVWLFDPLVTVDLLPEGARRLVWSPLRGCSYWDTARQRAEALSVDTGRGVADATHWRTRATQLCAVLLHAAALEDRSMATVCAWAHAQRAEPAQAFCQKAESQAALAVLQGLLRTPDRERGSIWSALQGMLSPFDTTRVCQAADAIPEFPFEPQEFLSSPNTVYVVSPSDAATDGAPLVVGLVEELRLTALRISDQTGALPIPWLLALDEVATICPLPGLPRLLAEGGGRNLVTLIAMQDLRQAAARWTPQGAQSFLTLAGAKVVLPGYADADTLQQLETLVGRHLASLTTTTSSRTKRHDQRHDDETESSSQRFVEQPRLPASAWRGGYPGSAWVLIGAEEPQQISLIDPERTQPSIGWLGPKGATKAADAASLPQR